MTDPKDLTPIWKKLLSLPFNFYSKGQGPDGIKEEEINSKKNKKVMKSWILKEKVKTERKSVNCNKRRDFVFFNIRDHNSDLEGNLDPYKTKQNKCRTFLLEFKLLKNYYPCLISSTRWT